ncbi:MAG: ABC transporter ATP-binding protein [Pseudomonadota bacterium]
MQRVRAEGVSFGYTNKIIITDVSITVNQGEIVSLLGPNGSGKTTLLKILLGLYRPQDGTVHLDGHPILSFKPRALARKIAYVPQTQRLSFAYRVLDMVLMGRLPHHSFFSRYSARDEAIALDALGRLSIAHLKDCRYSEISGGERQLTLIARALAQGAGVLVMDEPLNGLDYGNQIRLLEQICGLARDGCSIIKSTHFPDHALWIADRAVMIKEGVVAANGKPADVINEEALRKLYNAEIVVGRLPNGIPACVPRSLLGKNGDAATA